MSTLSHPLHMLRALTRALGVTALGAAILFGPPVVLVRFVGNPLPSAVPSWDDISFTVSSGQIEAWTWIRILAVVGWVAWAHLTASFAVEVVAVARGGTARAVRGLGLTQWLAARLVAQFSLVVSVLLQSGTASVAMALPPLPAAVVLEGGAEDGFAGGAVAGTPGGPGTGRDMPVAAEQAGPAIMVRRHDTLWGLAERHLGDGGRWEALREANAGRTMPDGTVLSATFTRVEQGWQLALPASARVDGGPSGGADAAADAPAGGASGGGGAAELEQADGSAVSVEVERGDNLWRLSEQRLSTLGAEPKAAEVLDYVNEVVDRNTDVIDDPDLIFPGQVFSFPNLSEVPDDTGGLDLASRTTDGSGGDRGPGDGAAITADPPDTTAPAVTAGAAGRIGGATRADVELAYPAGTGDHLRAEGDGGILAREPYRTIGSVSVGATGALLAVGARRLVRRRRRYRMAHRAPGTVPAPPGPELTEIERVLQRRGDEETVRWLEAAIASLGARPIWEGEEVAQPVLVRVHEDDGGVDVELSAADPMGAPLPWTTPDEGRHWQLDRSTAVRDLPAGGPAVVPTLVTVGVGTMVNLEGVGLVAIVGDGTTPMDLIRSVVHELATCPHAGSIDIRSTVPIAGTETYPLVQVQAPEALASELVPWLEDVGRQLDEARSSCAYAHRLTNDDEPLGPVVVVTDSVGLAALDPLPLYAQLRRLPLAVVVTGAVTTAELTIEVGPGEATLRPGGQVIEPQLLTADVAESLGALLLDAEQGGSEPLLAGVELSASVTDLRARLDETAERLAPAPRPGPGSVDDPVPDSPHDPAAAPLDRAEVAPPRPPGEPRAGGPGDGDPGPSSEAAGGEATTDTRGARPAVVIRVLGEVVAEGVPELTSQQLSMLTYLACHGPSTRAALIDALWDGQVISESRFPNLLAEVRARIGRDHLPEARRGRYTLVGVGTDLAEFERGVRAAAKQDDALAVVTLGQILDLVRGTPLNPPGRRFWSWVGDETHLSARVEALVADTAARLARLEHARGDLEGAVRACEQGLLASPADETLVILLTEAYLAQGKPGLARRVVDGWEDKISRMDCGEPSEEPRRRLAG